MGSATGERQLVRFTREMIVLGIFSAVSVYEATPWYTPLRLQGDAMHRPYDSRRKLSVPSG